MRLRDSLDLILVMALTVAVLTLMLLPGAPPWAVGLQHAVALPFVLLLPGYALMAAACGDERLTRAEMLAASIGTSLALAALGGFLLNLLPVGMRADTWAAALGSVTLVGGAVAFLRRQRPVRPHPHAARVHALRPPQWALLALAALTLGLAFGLAHVSAAQQHDTPFTQLWLVPSDGGATSGVRIGIDNREARQATYRLQLTRGTHVIQEWPDLVLDAGAQWETAVAVDEVGAPGSEPLEALLYQTSVPDEIYRRVSLRPRPLPTPVAPSAAPDDEAPGNAAPGDEGDARANP